MRYGLGSTLVATQRRTPYVSVNLTTRARNALQTATLQLSAQVDKRLPMSAVVLAALEVASQHPEEFLSALRPTTDEEGAEKEGKINDGD
jgi:hypothetical protein